MNYSDEIRWSVDLRWQSPKHHWGFYDIGEGILFRSAGKQVEKPDWEKFFSVDRKEIWQKKYFKQVKIFLTPSCSSNVYPPPPHTSNSPFPFSPNKSTCQPFIHALLIDSRKT